MQSSVNKNWEMKRKKKGGNHHEIYVINELPENRKPSWTYETEIREHSPEYSPLCRGPGEGGAIPCFCTQRLWNNRELAGTEKNEQKQ